MSLSAAARSHYRLTTRRETGYATGRREFFERNPCNVKKLFFAGVMLALLGLAGRAEAAYNWTGCYIGAQLGSVWGKSNVEIPLYPSSFDIHGTSPAAGPHAGCNLTVTGPWVIGVESDGSWMKLRDDRSSGGILGERYQLDWNWSATARGRAGFALDNILFYFTSGGAWAHLRCAKYLPGLSESPCKTGTHAGWTVGPGVDYGLTEHLIVGIEYLFASFERKTYVHSGPSKVDLDTHTARARLSWKF